LFVRGDYIVFFYSFGMVNFISLFPRYPIYNQNRCYFVRSSWSILRDFKNLSWLRLNYFIDITVYDNPNNTLRFVVFYQVASIKTRQYFEYITQINDSQVLHTVSTIFSGAKWAEREVWDLFGIFFFKHADLRHLLLDYGFDGYPMRKEFPLSGNVELFYDEKVKKLCYRNLELVQDSKNFLFTQNWIKNSS
jgi:NADH:ubiquinone oxidoreductase subunit C